MKITIYLISILIFTCNLAFGSTESCGTRKLGPELSASDMDPYFDILQKYMDRAEYINASSYLLRGLYAYIGKPFSEWQSHIEYTLKVIGLKNRADVFVGIDLINPIVGTISAQEGIGRRLTESEGLAVEQAIINVELLYRRRKHPSKFEIIKTQYKTLQKAGFSPSDIRKIISEI